METAQRVVSTSRGGFIRRLEIVGVWVRSYTSTSTRTKVIRVISTEIWIYILSYTPALSDLNSWCMSGLVAGKLNRIKSVRRRWKDLMT